MSTDRAHQLERFYELLAELEQQIGGARRLSQCDGGMDWTLRGICFFREPGEHRSDSGTGRRIVRPARTEERLQHQTMDAAFSTQRVHSGGGNHRSSIFRLILGTGLIECDGGYLVLAGTAPFIPDDPEEAEILLEADLLEKAYELAYQLNNRPRWFGTPLQGIEDLISPEG